MIWDELITEMDEALQIPGQVNAWTMPIKARIDMLTTGIRTPIGIKIFGPDLARSRKLGEHLESVMREVPGTRSVLPSAPPGGYYLDITPNRAEIARYGLNVEDVLMQVEISIGGMAIARTIEGRERYTINVRYGRELRDDPEKLKRVLVPVMSASLGEWRRWASAGGLASGGSRPTASGASADPPRPTGGHPYHQRPAGHSQ